LLYLTLVKDVFCTMQMMDHAINVLVGNGSIDGKNFSLHNLKNLAIISSERPKPLECKLKLIKINEWMNK